MGNYGKNRIFKMPIFAGLTILATGGALLLIKPLNALLMGESYAENLGVNVLCVWNILLVVTGLLTAVVTAFCGPIAFLALRCHTSLVCCCARPTIDNSFPLLS